MCCLPRIHRLVSAADQRLAAVTAIWSRRSPVVAPGYTAIVRHKHAGDGQGNEFRLTWDSGAACAYHFVPQERSEVPNRTENCTSSESDSIGIQPRGCV